MKTWTAYIEKDGEKYFVMQGKSTDIMGKVARKIADLGLPDDLVHKIEYEKIEVAWDMKNIEELT